MMATQFDHLDDFPCTSFPDLQPKNPTKAPSNPACERDSDKSVNRRRRHSIESLLPSNDRRKNTAKSFFLSPGSLFKKPTVSQSSKVNQASQSPLRSSRKYPLLALANLQIQTDSSEDTEDDISDEITILKANTLETTERNTKQTGSRSLLSLENERNTFEEVTRKSRNYSQDVPVRLRNSGSSGSLAGKENLPPVDTPYRRNQLPVSNLPSNSIPRHPNTRSAPSKQSQKVLQSNVQITFPDRPPRSSRGKVSSANKVNVFKPVPKEQEPTDHSHYRRSWSPGLVHNDEMNAFLSQFKN